MPNTATSVEVSKSFGRFGRQAMQAPITITHHGHASLVLLSHDEYQRLRRRDRVAMAIDEVPHDLRDAVAAAMPSVEAETYNSELD